MTFNQDFATSDIDLRAAEEKDREGVNLISSGLSDGTISERTLVWIAPDTVEILAIGYRALVARVEPTQGGAPALTQRRPRGKSFAISQDEDAAANFANVNPPGDEYFSGTVLAMPSEWHLDNGNNQSSGLLGTIGTYQTIFDPGLDSPTGPLVVREGDTIEVHLQQEGDLGPDDEQHYRHVLEIYYEEVPEEEAEVRQRGDFPSGRTI